ncbi:hypothetical protein B7494_g8329 [Chlorociboria aeruginascens]|nr:hypothetical protein B7494_g8329 [Chlorociboria aeruginascens]
MADEVHQPQAEKPLGHFSQNAARDRGHESALFGDLTLPDDTYTAEGTYFADLPFMKRVAFVNRVESKEAAKELRAIGAMTKADPLSPVGWYFKNAVLPGAGLGLEGYVLFSIGNLITLYSDVWPACWKTFKVCSQNWVAAVNYLEIIGIIVGQCLVGYLGDSLGRRWGLIQDALVMFLGLIMLIASWGLNLNGWVICYAWSLFIYGVGVGGEYPMTATAAMENATGSGKISTRGDRLHRGRNVTMAFLMQGWGQFFNQALLIILILIFNSGSSPPYSKVTAQWTYRLSFVPTAVGTLWLVYYRWYKMPLASRQLELAKKNTHVTGYDIESLKLTLKYFGPRLFATAGTWFANDVFFYGNKIFQGSFIKIISPNATLVESWLYNLLNVGVSLVGYYMASFLIDNKLYGRKMMMQVGFLLDFILFVVPAFHYNYYTSTTGIKAFQAMYFLSSFFNQFGPNSVTFLVAAEVFPTPIRASAHGFSAAVGKLGALFATVLYNYITSQQKFYIVPWFGLAGMVITAVFLPDTTGLDLKEQERRFKYLREGRESEYHGVAVAPAHLSWWENWTGRGKYYNPTLDRETKIDDLHTAWLAKEIEATQTDKNIEHDDDLTPEMLAYFGRTTPSKGNSSPALVEGSDSETNEKGSPTRI